MCCGPAGAPAQAADSRLVRRDVVLVVVVDARPPRLVAGDTLGEGCQYPSCDYGAAHNRAQPRIARSVRLTPAAAIVVTPAAAAIVVTKATVVTVESVRVATPPRVPELAWAPLRERPGLGLGYASRSQTDEP